jgi:amino acid adenylation domain-containing protein
VTSAWRLPVPAGHVEPRSCGTAETLVDRFRETAARFHDRLAVSGPSGALTYGELDAASDAMANALRQAAPAGRRFALLCDHDVGVPVAVWSTLKTGGAYVPLDPRQPDGRLATILAGAAVDAVLCDRALAARAAGLAGGKPLLALGEADAAGGAAGAGEARPAPGALAYVLHTSGSTGRPKGVMQTHANALVHAVTYARRVRIGSLDRVPLLARCTFDAAVMDLFGALLTGASLHVIDPATLTPAGLRAALARTAPTILHATPTLFRHLLRDGDERDLAPDLQSIRVVVLGGEEVTGDDLAAFYRCFPTHASLVNGYGPTECTLALQHLASRSDVARPSVPIGRPVEGIEAQLIDDEGRMAEQHGELVLRGRQLAVGYLDEIQSSGAFGVDPDGVPVYRTGDLARKLPDGTLLFAGRRDRQLKIRGQRVEPGEVEALLRMHPTVGQAVVVGRRRVERNPLLIGYVTSATPLPADPGELVSYLQRHLPAYSVPARIVVLAELPVGTTGKVDVARLPAPQDDLPAAGAAARTPLEQAVARIWCAVLGIASAGVEDNFVMSGGDSLQVLSLLSAVQGEFGIDLTLQGFLADPTIRWLAQEIELRSGQLTR